MHDIVGLDLDRKTISAQARWGQDFDVSATLPERVRLMKDGRADARPVRGWKIGGQDEDAQDLMLHCRPSAHD
jgi:hypothetical protein